MFSSFWLRPLLRRPAGRPLNGKPPTPRRPRRVRLGLEALEDRVTPSVTVTTTLDPTTPIAGQLSLREAINMVNAGQVADNTIILPAGAYQNTQGALNVTHSLILQGAGSGNTIIDGGGTDRVVLIDPTTAVNVQISGVTIRDGNTTGNGGGIDVQDGQGQSSVLTVTNCVITGNSAGSPNNGNTFGGGIFANNGDVNVVNSQITDNQVVAMDGGGFGGGIADGNRGTGNVTVTNSLIDGNTAGAEGGGIAEMNAGTGALTVTGSTISDNVLTAANAGGGGVFASSSGAVNISNTTIQGNTSLFDGGGFDEPFAGHGTILFNNDTITDNQSTQGRGGGIAVASLASVTIQNSTISGNSAAQAGGGIEFISGNANLTLTNSVVDSNRAGANGGGIDYEGNGGVALTDNTVSNNTAVDQGGGLMLGNQSQFLMLQGSTVSGNIAGTFGGGIENQTLSLVAANSIISNNLARDGDGGGIDDATSDINQTLTLTNDTLAGNGAGGNMGVGFGGGLYESNTTSTVAIVSCLFADNSATANGGAIEQAEGTLTVRASQFSGNVAAGTGGALDFNAATALTVSDSTFNNNQTESAGGALDFNSGESNSSLNNDTFVANTAVGDGGAVAIDNGLLALVNDTINGNTAGGNGGGVSDEASGTHSFQNTIVAGNSAGGKGPDVFVLSGLSVTDNGGNFIGNLSGSAGFGAGTLTGNPLLGPLQNNGGSLAGASGDQQVVQTEALLLGSPAIGKGVANGAPTSDERGFSLATPPDIGAFQFQDASLTATITAATPTVTINGTETFTIAVNNMGGNALPADNSTLTLMLSPGLATTGPLTFTLGAIPAGQSQNFTVTATATTLNTQTVTATVTSPDANPNSASGSAAINVVMSPPAPLLPPTTNPATTNSPIGSLTLFAFGFGPTGIDLFEVDSAGDIFALPFMGGGAPLFVNTALHLPQVVLADGQLLALLAGNDGQDFLIDIINPFSPLVEPAVLAALQIR